MAKVKQGTKTEKKDRFKDLKEAFKKVSNRKKFNTKT